MKLNILGVVAHLTALIITVIALSKGTESNLVYVYILFIAFSIFGTMHSLKSLLIDIIVVSLMMKEELTKVNIEIKERKEVI